MHACPYTAQAVCLHPSLGYADAQTDCLREVGDATYSCARHTPICLPGSQADPAAAPAAAGVAGPHGAPHSSCPWFLGARADVLRRVSRRKQPASGMRSELVMRPGLAPCGII